MATQKEKALNILAKQIKELDDNSILLDELRKTDTPLPINLTDVRNIMFNVIKANGYALEFPSYKLVKLK